MLPLSIFLLKLAKANSGVKNLKLNLVQIIFYWKLLLLQRMFTRFTHLISPKKIKRFQELRKTGDGNDTIIKRLSSSENSS